MAINVLLIDDDREFLEILSERLTIRDMHVVTAPSALAALEILQDHTFDVVILDLQMPEMDGLQALEEMRASHPGLQIILLTGHATVARSVQAMKLGAVDVLEKPMDIRELVAKINSTSRSATNLRRAELKKSEEAHSRGMLARFWAGIRELFH